MPLISQKEQTLSLHSPTAMPLASAFLWNREMMIQVNCRGYASAQFMQPEPAKYARGPALEATSFMQPEQAFYAHHPGRFFYIKDDISGALFSAPYEPVRAKLDKFEFIAGQDHISWQICKWGLCLDISVRLSDRRPLEIWQLKVTNGSDQRRRFSLYPYFPIGYMSWMNQSASYDASLQAIICKSITPYQKYPDYFKNRDLKDSSFLLADQAPASWETRQQSFEGEGGLHAPSAIDSDSLGNSSAEYETPTAAMQYRLNLEPEQKAQFNFLFGPARDAEEIQEIRDQYFGSRNSIAKATEAYRSYIAKALDGSGSLQVSTPDKALDQFVNCWLPRQIYYHGDSNRLCTDPQTRNFLQDTMGLSYIEPARSRRAFLQALSQQKPDGAMPEGILLAADAELKYINQIPHTDHCVWLAVCLRTYLDETNDLDILRESIPFAADASAECAHIEVSSVFEHICRALRYLLDSRDEKGLSYIAQGDWCDPMNMVGYQGKGVSTWLTLATAYALNEWAYICRLVEETELAREFEQQAEHCNLAVNQYLWHGNWYARGITDGGNLFGVEADREGRIFLNPQSWAILSGAADSRQIGSMIEAIEAQLETPFGVAMLAPAYTSMREDIGRVTQKFPGSAENGSVYNHASAFYVYALFKIGEADRAFRLLRQMIVGSQEQDLLARGQLPLFIPNYYRGACQQFPRTAGRSSQLFNTGTVHWFYRCLIDGLFGLRGEGPDLLISPQIPSDWPRAQVTRKFRGAQISMEIVRCNQQSNDQFFLDGVLQDQVSNGEPKQGYRIKRIEPRPYTARFILAAKMPISSENPGLDPCKQ